MSLCLGKQLTSLKKNFSQVTDYLLLPNKQKQQTTKQIITLILSKRERANKKQNKMQKQTKNKQTIEIFVLLLK